MGKCENPACYREARTRCAPCARYLKRHGVERPPELIAASNGRALEGWAYEHPPRGTCRVGCPTYGRCHCGCLEPTSLADRTCPDQGAVAGEPRVFLPGHQHRKSHLPPSMVREVRYSYTTAGPVIVVRPDGRTEVQPPYTPEEVNDIVLTSSPWKRRKR